MDNFKVICKADRCGWQTIPVPTKIIVVKKLFGLIKNECIVPDPKFNGGPDKDEICIVYEEYNSSGRHYYKLKGYPQSGYDSRFFVRLDEFTETQKEIAEKSQPILN